jgi:lipopolysaccharide/colanic/teichoic acid biosynthesis glycosyltransferase
MTVMQRSVVHGDVGGEREASAATRLARPGAPLDRPVYRFAKRCFDLAMAVGLLALTAPVWIVVALLIRLTSPGPVLYKQLRVGRNGKPFFCYKFRTMRADADQILAADPALADAFARAWKLTNDPRITPIGRWLRKSSIDELPQLINLLRGEMSVVGPRPVQPRELEEQFGALAPLVVSVKPGLTSLWSVSGRSLLSYEERVALEAEYVRRRGFRLDLRILLLTIPSVITGRGAM